MIDYAAFTHEYDKIVTSLRTKVSVSPTDHPKRQKECLAIWDTGAEVTVLGEDLVKALHLQPDPTEKQVTLITPSGARVANPYRVDIALPNGVVKRAMRVLDCAP